MEGRGVAAGKSTAGDLGSFTCFEDEAGQGLRPPKGRTWAPRGARPVVQWPCVKPCRKPAACRNCYVMGRDRFDWVPNARPLPALPARLDGKSRAASGTRATGCSLSPMASPSTRAAISTSGRTPGGGPCPRGPAASRPAHRGHRAAAPGVLVRMERRRPLAARLTISEPISVRRPSGHRAAETSASPHRVAVVDRDCLRLDRVGRQ